MKRRLLLIVSCLAALLAFLAVAQIVLAGMVFDRKIDSVLSRVQQRVPALSLHYQPQNSGFSSRSGRIDWELKLPAGNALGLPAISGSTMLELSFGLLKVNAAFSKVEHSGNLDELLAKLNLQPIGYRGALSGTLLPPKVEAAVRSTPFTLPLTYGSCAVGENSLYASASGVDAISAELNVVSLHCRGSERYAAQESFAADLNGLTLRVDPRWDSAAQRLYVDSLQVALSQLTAEVSTLFMIGFTPDARVKDPTLRDRIEFTDLSASLAFSPKDATGRSYLRFDSSGNYAWAFPFVARGKMQPLYRLDKLKLEGRAGRVAAKDLFKALTQLDAAEGVEQLLNCFSARQEVDLTEFSFEHQGQRAAASGKAAVELDFAALKIKALQADFKLAGGSAFVQSLIGTEYADALADLVRAGYVTQDGGSYRTHLTIHNQDIRLNQRLLQLKAGED